MSPPVTAKRPQRLYLAVGLFMAVWAAVLTVLTVKVVPDLYWYSYYAVDYTLGFVRRGLAGELVALLPGDDRFFEQRVGRWASSLAYLGALAALTWWVATKPRRSERRLQTALLTVALPFGFAFGMLQAGSTLFGGAALILFGIAVARAQSTRSVLITCAAYGAATVVGALLHEAIPLLFGLGAIAVLVLLADPGDRRVRWLSSALALGPGLVTALAVAALGRHGIGQELCAFIPHGRVNNPLAGNPTPGQLLHGFRYFDDYHDWACRNITPFYDRGFGDAVRYVGRLGAPGMIVNTVYGIGMFAVTMLAIGWVSGVAPRRIWMLLRRRVVEVSIGIGLIVPVFLTGVDWSRWWVNISLDIGLAYLLFAVRQPEMDTPPTRRSTRAFLAAVIVLALIPVGIVPAFMAPLPI